jgi:hypothetical protein
MSENKTILEAAAEARELVVEMIAARERAIRALREIAIRGAEHEHGPIVLMLMVEREAESLADYLERDGEHGFHFAEAMGHALELDALAKLAMVPLPLALPELARDTAPNGYRSEYLSGQGAG